MRKAMTANKIAKRATAMILALVMVFGLTITVYAEEDTENEVIAEVAAVESAEATASTEAPAGEAPTEDNAGAAQLIDAAEAAVIADGLATDDSDAVVVL